MFEKFKSNAGQVEEKLFEGFMSNGVFRDLIDALRAEISIGDDGHIVKKEGYGEALENVMSFLSERSITIQESTILSKLS